MDSDNQETLSEEKEPENVSECNKKINKYIRFPVLTIEKILRLVIVTGGTIFMIVSFFTGIGYSHHEIECINDIPQDDTERINNYFYENEGFALAVKFIISFIIDILIIYTLIVWSLFGTNIRLMSTGCTYFIVNLIVRFLHIQIQPEKSAFTRSHIFSFFVNYQVSTHSFYSLTLGIFLICAFEWKRNKVNYMFWIMFVILVLDVIFLIFMRGNYFHEIFTAIVFGHYFFIINEKVLEMIYGKEYLNNELKISSNIPIIKDIDSDTSNLKELKESQEYETQTEDN
jgi:hypothetical protein